MNLPLPEHSTEDYWDRRGRSETIVRHQGERRADAFREHPVWAGAVPLLLTPSEGQRPLRRVADLGCGTGIVAEILARLGHKVIAIDLAHSRLGLARERLAAYPNAECRLGDAANPPLESGEVDAIVSRNLLWLLPEPGDAVRRWRNLVAPGGRVAAIEATRRTDRTWLHTLRRHLGVGDLPQRGGPLASAPDASPAAEHWHQAGLRSVRTLDLSWVTTVRLHNAASPVPALLNRSCYYGIVGDTAG